MMLMRTEQKQMLPNKELAFQWDFFPTLVPGSGSFQLSGLAGLRYGLGLGF